MHSYLKNTILVPSNTYESVYCHLMDENKANPFIRYSHTLTYSLQFINIESLKTFNNS